MDIDIIGNLMHKNHTQTSDITVSDSPANISPLTQILTDAEELLGKFSIDYQKMAE